MRALLTICILLLLGMFVLWWAVSPKESGERDFRDAEAEIGGAVLNLEISDTPEERALGLSGLERLEEDMGMLFVFDAPHRPRFWMRDMHFAIDILWLDEDLRVVDVSERLSPDSYRSPNDAERYSPSEPALYALEVVAGFAEEYEIKKGDLLTLSSGALNDREN